MMKVETTDTFGGRIATAAVSDNELFRSFGTRVQYMGEGVENEKETGVYLTRERKMK